MSDDVTSAQIKVDTWEELNKLKRPGDSMDDVITRLLDDRKSDGGENGGKRVAANS